MMVDRMDGESMAWTTRRSSCGAGDAELHPVPGLGVDRRPRRRLRRTAVPVDDRYGRRCRWRHPPAGEFGQLGMSVWPATLVEARVAMRRRPIDEMGMPG